MLPMREPAVCPLSWWGCFSARSSPLGTPLMWVGPTPCLLRRARAGRLARRRFLATISAASPTRYPIRSLLAPRFSAFLAGRCIDSARFRIFFCTFLMAHSYPFRAAVTPPV